MASVEFRGFDELRAAVARNPKRVYASAQLFLTRAMAEYRRGIQNAPWRVGGSGGGAPVDTHNLRDTHVSRITGLTASIGPNLDAAPYAPYVHDGTARMRARPWLDFVRDDREPAVEKLADGLLEEITSDLAK